MDEDTHYFHICSDKVPPLALEEIIELLKQKKLDIVHPGRGEPLGQTIIVNYQGTLPSLMETLGNLPLGITIEDCDPLANYQVRQDSTRTLVERAELRYRMESFGLPPGDTRAEEHPFDLQKLKEALDKGPPLPDDDYPPIDFPSRKA